MYGLIDALLFRGSNGGTLNRLALVAISFSFRVFPAKETGGEAEIRD
jgi:hypothetical protein